MILSLPIFGQRTPAGESAWIRRPLTGRVMALRAAVLIGGFLFMSPAANGDSEVLDKLELRSILAMGGAPEFSLHDKERGMSFWISLNQTRHGIEITDYDSDKDEIVVRHEGNTRRLQLSDSEIVALEAPSDAPTQSSSPFAGRGERSDQRNPQEMLQHITETWEEQISRNHRIRELDEHLGEYYSEFADIRQRMWSTSDHDSREFRELRERRRELREEIGVLHNLTQRQIENNPAFEDIDRRQLLATLRHRHMTSGREGDERE